MPTQFFVAVDLGAGSGRVFLSATEDGNFHLEEVRRFTYPPRDVEGTLRWDFEHIFGEICVGLSDAARRVAELDGDVISIGVDSWGVDHGLLDAEGKLLHDPACYRDLRTIGMMERAFTEMSRAEIFERTGIQFQSFNTLYQLLSEGDHLNGVAKMLLLPDLIDHRLTGRVACEYTNATTTQMVNAASGEWDEKIIKRLGIPRAILPELIPSGTILGTLLPALQDETGLGKALVVAPAAHDTGSAVAAAPLGRNSAFISSGTWSLVGVELDRPLICEEALAGNFTNEGGVYGTIRFLKNVSGLWLLESCRKEWQSAGRDVSYEILIDSAFASDEFRAFIYPDDPRFLNPPSMTAAIVQQLAETGQSAENEPVVIAKIIFDSLAFRYASVLRSIESMTGRKLDSVEILGGGGRNRYLDQMTANASQKAVRAGIFEATVVGNVLVQAIAAGRFGSLAEAREYVEAHTKFESFEPQQNDALRAAAERYEAVEQQFIGRSAA